MAPTTCLLTKKTKIYKFVLHILHFCCHLQFPGVQTTEIMLAHLVNQFTVLVGQDGTRLPLHVACFQHFVQWQFATGHFHHFGSGSLRHVLRYLFIYYYFQNVQNQIVTF